MSGLFLYVLPGCLIFLLLWITGLIGTPKQKAFFKRTSSRQSQNYKLFFPLDPNKPIKQAWDEASENALPTKKRARNVFGLVVIAVVLGILLRFLIFDLIIPRQATNAVTSYSSPTSVER